MIIEELPALPAATVWAPAPNGIDDTAAVAALIGPARTIQLQRGIYNLTGAIGINLDGVADVVLRGAAGEWNSNSGTVINYTGAGTAISLRGTGGSSNGCVISNLVVRSNTAAILVDFGTTGAATAPGTSNCKVEKVYFDSTSTTNILLNLAQAISCHVDDCAFVGGGVAIQGVTTANGFSNTQTIACSHFKNQTTIPIRNPCQNWLVIGNTFEPLLSGAAGAILDDGTTRANRPGTGVENLTLIGNSFQDVTNAGTWCTLRGTGIAIVGNMFDSTVTNHVLFAAAVTGVTITGNNFGGAITAAVNNSAGGSGTTAFFMMGNQFANGGNDIVGNPGSGSMYTTPGTLGQNLFGFTFVQGGPLDVATIGHGLRVAEGANAKQGLSAAMVAGTVTVANTSVTATSRIVLTRQDGGTNPGAVYVSARTAGTSFTITSTNAADTGQVAYQIFEVG